MNDSIEPVAPPPAAETATAAPAAAAVPPAARGTASDTPPARRGRKLTVPLAAAALAAALLALGIVPRIDARAAQRAQVAAQQALPVSVVVPGTAPADQTLTLPGAVTPYADASIYARTSGYIAHWSADLGTHVKAGQTLAQISAPDLDAQLRQARADEASAQANYDYAKSTAQRWQDMLKTQSVSQQDTDTKVADMNAKRAMLAAAQANVAHLAELVSYESVTAPFDGVITARNVDVGTLVTAGGTPGSPGLSGELFHLEQTDTLRVFVDVPQDSATGVSTGTPVYLTTPQYPGRRIAARVARSAGAIDPVTRTLRVEIDVDNRDGALMPGAYAQAHLVVPSAAPALDLPVSALLFRPNGVTVATVGANGRTALKIVQIGRDFGTRVEIVAGLAATDRVIDNPGDAITTGETVKIVSTAHDAAPVAASPASAASAASAAQAAQPASAADARNVPPPRAVGAAPATSTPAAAPARG
ncbi:efflux RND transporter periplasmic adaptor subunit [Burkholderia sp. BCCIQ04A]|uniref:Efflux RND transporter periplasmic adaptor subunit n=1 Tax=Burkholderia anthinoferrum TaxID=3090833 RepID=A0ABU5WE72_9BURK|nr:efflux RND transporter periplasmic adaptor subunit [Burkholderia anthinoferrum]MEB2507227.1 efflux RND transporter periplasmic adaptor subunit [Burkholderia anthinoferrum]MEB2535406.1 efflux RND transporter periplasmic adaptor subunit [Burkholderia anthinoferrum]MEB2560294.1 efflux RND transporter periplasmic adaptor subunit [Burkholderia anthinoferrum]MEB2577406.1 efflux RND transporter periplasmic adaptor subunit [Burkholderia anthinoferrum]MEB2633828.1 efflux RND transporter periplasmic 